MRVLVLWKAPPWKTDVPPVGEMISNFLGGITINPHFRFSCNKRHGKHMLHVAREEKNNPNMSHFLIISTFHIIDKVLVSFLVGWVFCLVGLVLLLGVFWGCCSLWWWWWCFGVFLCNVLDQWFLSSLWSDVLITVYACHNRRHQLCHRRQWRQTHIYHGKMDPLSTHKFSLSPPIFPEECQRLKKCYWVC